jgi:superfamily II DNA or RNA helicase
MLQIQRKQFLSNLESARNVCRKLLVKLYKDESNKIIIFCGLTEQADKICKYSYHAKSTEDNLTLFDEGSIRVISVVGKIDRGVNIDGANTVIFESPTKSSTKFIQRSGRSRRLPIEQTTHIYYLIPYYIDRRGELRPTVVRNWVDESTSKINFKPSIYEF